MTDNNFLCRVCHRWMGNDENTGGDICYECRQELDAEDEAEAHALDFEESLTDLD